MRTIKFRGKRVDKPEEWVYGSAMVWNGFAQIFVHHHMIDNNWVVNKYPVIPETVGEWTGLQDKNKVDAYEKDFDADGNMIDWCDRCCGYQFFQIDVPTNDIIFCHNCEGNFMLHDYLSDFEITNNLTDNKDLL